MDILGGILNESLWFMLFCNHEKCKRFVLCQRSCLCNASLQGMYVCAIVHVHVIVTRRRGRS